MFGAHHLRLTTGDLPYSSVAPCQERFSKVRGRRGFRGHVAHDLVVGATLQYQPIMHACQLATTTGRYSPFMVSVDVSGFGMSESAVSFPTRSPELHSS